MVKLFGTDGVRGKAGEYPMVPEFALKFARVAGAELAKKHKRVAIGRDTRISGNMLESALVSGFNAVGVDVVLLGVLPTPVMTSSVSGLNVDLGVMITASHNPYYDNGLKLITGDGGRFSSEVTNRMESLILDENYGTPTFDGAKNEENKEVIGKYIQGVMKIVPSLKGLRVVLDCANGAFYNILSEVFKDLGAGVIVLSDKPDGYNINKDCGSMHPETMCETVVNSNAHLGIAVDGDGDRIVVCDEKGKRVDSDQVVAFLAKSLGVSDAVATIVSNLGLKLFCESAGIKYYETPVGEAYVIEKMKEIGAKVGGEESGHMVLLEHSKTGDALVVALVIASKLLESGKKMSEIFPLFQPYPKRREDVVFSKKENMSVAVKSEEVQNVIEECRKIMGDKGKVLVRPSGTEPKVQVWVWGENQEQVVEMNQKIAAEVKRFA